MGLDVMCIVFVALFCVLGLLSGFLSQVVRLAALVGAFVLTMTGMAINMGLTANYFGTIDREGFVTLTLSPLKRWYVLLSANLAALLYAGTQFTVISLAIAIITGAWAMLPLGICLGLCLQIGSTPAYNLAAIIGPYRAQLKFSGGRQRGNLWGLVAWLVSAPPVLALIGLPYVFWKPGLALTLPLQNPAKASPQWRAEWENSDRLSLAKSFARADGERVLAEIVDIEDLAAARRFYSAVGAEQPAAEVRSLLGSGGQVAARRAGQRAANCETSIASSALMMIPSTGRTKFT